MAEKKTFNLGLTIVALVALVSIVSLVALVLFGARAPTFATGGQIVQAQDTVPVEVPKNLAGNVMGYGCFSGGTFTTRGGDKVTGCAGCKGTCYYTSLRALD